MVLPDGYFLQHKKYQLTHTIGQGGFGITYLGVWNTEVKGELGAMKTTVPVCIKEYFFKDYCYREKNSCAVKVHSVTGEKLFGRFKEKLIKEANILSAVHHPYIVNVLEVFEENNTAYIVMEYIKGCSLKYMLEKEGVLPENKTLKYMHQVGNALAFVHEKNIVHLDIKPGNILIDANDNARLIDFGVSKRYDIEEQETSTTTLTLSKGFASIEQYDDEGTQTFSPCPDVYSLGATVYNLLTGVVPVESILRATKQLLPPSDYNSNISPKTEEAILKAMEIKPKDRFQSVKEMLSALDVPPYELAENKLLEKTQQGGDDHTEAIHTNGAPPAGQASSAQSTDASSQTTDDDDDRTIVTSAGGQKEKKTSEPKGKTKRKVLTTATVLIGVFIGYAVYSYFSDGVFSSGTYTGVRLQVDSLTQSDNGTDLPDGTLASNQPGDASSGTEERARPDEQTAGQGQTEGQSQTPSSSTPPHDNGASTGSGADQATGTPNDASRSQLPQNTSTPNELPDDGLPAHRNGVRGYTDEQLATFEKEYQAHLSAGKAKMESPVSDYKGALEDFRKALKVVESTGVKSVLEVDRLIKTCTEQLEKQEREKRLANYKTFYAYGDLMIARNEITQLFGAINADGKEIIPCKYITTNKRSNAPPEFLREDGLVDIYDKEGNERHIGIQGAE